MISRSVFILLTAAGILAAPMRNSQHDAIHQSDLIVVADVLSIRIVPDGTFMDCQATISPVRTLKSEAGNAGGVVAVHWQYTPPHDETAPANLEGTHALW